MREDLLLDRECQNRTRNRELWALADWVGDCRPLADWVGAFQVEMSAECLSRGVKSAAGHPCLEFLERGLNWRHKRGRN